MIIISTHFRHYPKDTMQTTLVQQGITILFLAGWCLITTGVGRLCLSSTAIRFASRGEGLFLSAGIGLAITGYAVFLLGVTGSLDSFRHPPSPDISGVVFRGGLVAPYPDRSGGAVRTFRLGPPGRGSPWDPPSRRFSTGPDPGDRQRCADLPPRRAETLSPSSWILFHPRERLRRLSAPGRDALSSGPFPPERHPCQGDELCRPLRNPPRNGSFCPLSCCRNMLFPPSAC